MTTSVWLRSIALLLGAAIAGDPFDEEAGDNALLPAQRPIIADPTAHRWVFGESSTAVAAYKQLDTLLAQKVAVVDRICGLTDVQKEKLQLAGRGDNKRLIDRAVEIGTQIQLVKNDPGKVKKLAEQAKLFRHGLIEPGFSNDGLLFVKVLERLLTAEQLERYKPLRVVFRAGGLVQMWQHGPDDELGISLNGTSFTDDDLAHLSKLSVVQTLTPKDRPVTSAGLGNVKRPIKLVRLSLGETQVTDSGLVYLKGLTTMHHLTLNNTPVTDAGLAHLKGLTELEFLWLANTQVTDAGLAHLKGMTKLEFLWLANTQVTDAGLTHLKALTSLQNLWINNTQVTNAGVAGLQRALPRLAIVD